MAHGLSSKKRIRQNKVRRVRNHARKQSLKTVIRKFTDAVHDGDVDRAHSTYSSVSKLLDQAAARGTIHRNAASRHKSRLARRLYALTAGVAS